MELEGLGSSIQIENNRDETSKVRSYFGNCNLLEKPTDFPNLTTHFQMWGLLLLFVSSNELEGGFGYNSKPCQQFWDTLILGF